MFRWIALKAINRVLSYVDKKVAQDPTDEFLLSIQERLVAAKSALEELKR